MKQIAAIVVFLLLLVAPVAADETINQLGTGTALGGSEQIPMFQGSNPAVTTTPNAIKSFVNGARPAVTSSLVDSTSRTGTTGTQSTISGILLGSAFTGRVVCVAFFLNSGSVTIEHATLGGVPATTYGQPSDAAYWACAAGTGGTSGSLVLTLSTSGSATSDGAVALTAANGSAPFAVETVAASAGTLDVPQQGTLIAYTGAASAGSWTGANQLLAWNANGDSIASFDNSGSGLNQRTISYSTGAFLVALSFSPVTSTTRTKLQSGSVFNVASTGNDATGDGSAGNPWRTIQNAVNQLSWNYDCSGNNVTINVGSGTFAGVGLRPQVGCPSIYINGAGKANTSIIASYADGIYSFGENIASIFPTNTYYYFDNVTIDGTNTSTVESIGVYSSFVGLGNYLTQGGDVALKFNSSQYFVRLENTGSQFQDPAQLGTVTISGSAPGYVEYSGGFVSIESNYTVVGSPIWSAAFLQGYDIGDLSGYHSTFTGTATGPSCSLRLNAIIDTGGLGASHFPGDVACSGAAITSGGQYN